VHLLCGLPSTHFTRYLPPKILYPFVSVI
jgi:hypothetical protein